MKLPTLDEMIGIDKFNLTESQKHDCRSLANHRGFDVALEQAKKKFSSNNDQFQYCPSCEKETFQNLNLYNPDDPESELVWVCNECKESVSFN